MIPTVFKRNNTNRGLDNLINDIMSDDFFTTTPRKRVFRTPVNIIENEASYAIEVQAAGYSKDEVSIKIDKDLMTIKGEKAKSEKNEKDKYVSREFKATSFERSFTLPKTVEGENVKAKFSNGILTVTIPKKEEAKAKPALEVKIS